MDVFDVDDRIRVRGRFTVENAAEDPTDVRFQIRKPSGATIDARLSVPADGVSREGAAGSGVFVKEILLDEPGLWYVKTSGIGAVEAARTVAFRVRNDPFS